MIHLACTLGNLGYWDYYSTVMKVEDIVLNNRIITVSESEELFTNNINEILQREVKQTRIKAISLYIQNNNERFLGSIVLAIHKGNPKWTEININQNFKIDDIGIDDSSVDFLNSKFGVLTLLGDEQIFALDGQHRLLGLRKALAENSELGKLEIPIVFVIHKHEQLEKTRRLFTVLNKYAERPRGAELIILDEDDAAAIISRKLVSEHEILSKPNGISTSKNGSIPKNDNMSLTTLVTVNAVNKILFSKDRLFYLKRPSDEDLETLYAIAVLFWDTIFECFPELVEYIDNRENVEINNLPIYRNHSTGGSLLLRPVGHTLLAHAFIKFEPEELQVFKDRLKHVEFNLSSNNWKYLYWNEKMLTGEDRLKKNVLFYILGKYDEHELLHLEMSRVYELNNLEYDNQIVRID